MNVAQNVSLPHIQNRALFWLTSAFFSPNKVTALKLVSVDSADRYESTDNNINYYKSKGWHLAQKKWQLWKCFSSNYSVLPVCTVCTASLYSQFVLPVCTPILYSQFVLSLRSLGNNRPKTNHPIKGLVSTDRSVEAALLNTTPWPVTKSSANDFAPRHCTGYQCFSNYIAIQLCSWAIFWGLFSQDQAYANFTSQHLGAKLSLRYLGGILT